MTIPEQTVQAVYDHLCRVNGDWQPIGPNDIKDVLTAALPHLPGVGVKVKPLDWMEDSAPGYRLFSAQSDIGHFAYGTDADGNPWSSSPLGIKDHANEEAAKRAAEKAHHELVVDQAKAIGLELSALEPSAARELALEDSFRKGLEAACEVIDAHSEYDLQLCCNGRECGCCGTTVHQSMQHYIRSLSSPDHADAGKVEGDGWLPIESAPKDGSVILVYREDAGVFTAHYVEEDAHLSSPMNPPEGDFYWFSTAGDDLTNDMPTYWRSLPLAPASEGTSNV